MPGLSDLSGAISETDVGESDLEVLSAVSRTVHDQSAFDEMILAIDARLDLDRRLPATGTAARSLPKLLGSIERLLGMALGRTQAAVGDGAHALVDAHPMAAAIVDTAGSTIYCNRAWHSEDAALGVSWILGVQARWPDLALPRDCETLVPVAGASFPFFQVRRVATTDRRTAYLLRAIGIAIDDDLADFFAEVLNLTTAEFAVLQLLAMGLDRETIAERRGSSAETVKRQLATIFRKAGVHSLPDCLRVAHLAAASQRQADPLGNRWRDPWHHEQTLVRPGGQPLCWSWTGDPAGRPCLLVHGPDIGYALTPQWHEFLRENGIRLFAMQRPGYGNSGMDPAEDPFTAHCDAIAHLVAAVTGPPVCSIGLHNGALPLLKLRADGRIGAGRILANSDILPMTRERLERQPAVVRAWFRMAWAAPTIVPMAAKIGLNHIRRHGPQWYVQRSFGASAADRAAIGTEPVKRALDSSVSLMCAQGIRGFIAELTLLSVDPSAWLEIGETDWLGGEEDPSVDWDGMHSLAVGPKLFMRSIPNAGQLAFLSHPGPFQEVLLDCLEHGA